MLAALALLAVAGSASAARAPITFADCLGKPQVRPADLVIACGDGNESISGITWVGWGSVFAAGRGVATINDCNPNCAAGRDHDYPVIVLLTGRQTCRPGGQAAYLKLTIAFLDSRPHTTGTAVFRCRPR